MKGWFSYRGFIYNILLFIYNLMVLNVLFIVFSIPIITLGASLNSLYVCTVELSTDRFTPIAKLFVRNFGQEFFRSTKLFVGLVASFFVISGLIYFSVFLNYSMLTFFIFFLFSYFLLILTIIFPINALYKGTISVLLNNSFVFLKTELLTSIFLLILSLLTFVLIPIYFPQFILFHLLLGFAAMAFFQVKIIKKRILDLSKKREKDH